MFQKVVLEGEMNDPHKLMFTSNPQEGNRNGSLHEAVVDRSVLAQNKQVF